jgi:peptidoglycan/LPS O-acetylase OafA/YrhL
LHPYFGCLRCCEGDTAEVVHDRCQTVTGSGHHYVPAFDGLRALAILPVILLHVSVLGLQPGWLRQQLTRGWYGVDLFFVLSGFLITWLLIEEIEATGTIALPRFYLRRFLRLGPAYASMLLALLVAAAVFNHNTLHKVAWVAPALLTYTYNYQLALEGPHIDSIVIVWSLCVEEHFYLVWPWILRRLGIHRGFYFSALAVLILALYRTGLYAWMNWGHFASPTAGSRIRIYFSTDTRIDVIMVGCLVALSLRYERTRQLWEKVQQWRVFPYAAAVVALICVAWLTGGHSSSASVRSATVGYTLGAITVAAVIIAILARPGSRLSRSLSWSPLVSVGKVSYGMYLFHLALAQTIFELLDPEIWYWAASREGPQSVSSLKRATISIFEALGSASRMLAEYPLAHFIVAFVFVTLAAFGVAWLHFRFVERKFMALRPSANFRARDCSSQSIVEILFC